MSDNCFSIVRFHDNYLNEDPLKYYLSIVDVYVYNRRLNKKKIIVNLSDVL